MLALTSQLSSVLYPGDIRRWNEDREFIAADPADDILFAELSTQHGRKFFYHRIAEA